jgi:predicted anti-sigma-YlaC factor YlaD
MMSKKYCEKVRLSAMAILDGEASSLSEKVIDEHLKSCANCRHELEQQKEVIGSLDKQSRQFLTEDIYSRIVATIEESGAKLKGKQGLCPFMMLGLILLSHKIIEVLPGFTSGLVMKLIPVVLVFVFFGLLKQNPFKVNQNLKLEGDTK